MNARRSKIWSLADEEFKSIVLREKTSQKIIEALGLRLAGTAYTGLKIRLQQLGLYDVVSSNNAKLRADVLRPKKRLTNKQIFVKHRRVTAHRLKVALQSVGCSIETCEICGQPSVWNNQRLVLQVDHKNGDHCDNRRENLQIVCPNCHTQTDTFGVRNRLKIENTIVYCKKCRKPTAGTGASGLCISCAQHNRRKVLARPILDKLVQEVKTLGYSATGRKYGVSDNAVRKWLKNKSGNCPVI